MNFDTEIDIWLVFCLIGLITSACSLRLATLVLNAVKDHSRDQEVIDGSKHLWRTELERVAGWSMFFTCGVLALFDAPDTQAPIGVSTVGAIIRWGLISTIVVWSYKTASDFRYSRHLWLRTKNKLLSSMSGK